MGGFPGGAANMTDDWAKYNPLVIETNVVPATTSSWYTVLNVSGKGYLTRLLGWTSPGGTQNTGHWGRMRITIDGVQKFFVCVAGWVNTGPPYSNYMGGFTLEALVNNGFIAEKNATWTGLITSLPFTSSSFANQTSDILILASPLFFNNNVTIEMQAGDASGITMYLSARGGIR